jgi:hypothetical protein
MVLIHKEDVTFALNDPGEHPAVTHLTHSFPPSLLFPFAVLLSQLLLISSIQDPVQLAVLLVSQQRRQRELPAGACLFKPSLSLPLSLQSLQTLSLLYLNLLSPNLQSILSLLLMYLNYLSSPDLLHLNMLCRDPLSQSNHGPRVLLPLRMRHLLLALSLVVLLQLPQRLSLLLMDLGCLLMVLVVVVVVLLGKEPEVLVDVLRRDLLRRVLLRNNESRQVWQQVLLLLLLLLLLLVLLLLLLLFEQQSLLKLLLLELMLLMHDLHMLLTLNSLVINLLTQLLFLLLEKEPRMDSS